MIVLLVILIVAMKIQGLVYFSMATIFPFNSSNVQPISAPTESLELRGYLQGLEASKRAKNTATSIFTGIQQGLDNYNTQTQAQQAQALNDLSIERQQYALNRQPTLDQQADARYQQDMRKGELSIEQLQNSVDRQPILNETDRLKLEIAQLDNERAKATKELELNSVKTQLEQETLDAKTKLEDLKLTNEIKANLSSDNTETARSILTDPKYRGLLARNKQLANDVVDSLHENEHMSDDEYQKYYALEAQKQQIKDAAIASQQYKKEALEAKAAYSKTDQYVKMVDNLGLDPNNASSLNVLAQNAVPVLAEQYQYSEDGSKVVGVVQDFDPITSEGKYNLISIDGKKLNGLPLTKEDVGKFNGLASSLRRANQIAKIPTEKDFTFLNKMTEDPTEEKNTGLFSNAFSSVSKKISNMTQTLYGADRVQKQAETPITPATQPNVDSRILSEKSNAIMQKRNPPKSIAVPSPNANALGTNPYKYDPNYKQMSYTPEDAMPDYTELYNTFTPKKGTRDAVAQKVNTEPLLSDESTLVKAVAAVESAGNREAVSPTGVKGLMQMTKATAKELGFNRDIPEQNVAAGKKYLESLAVTFQGNIPLVIGAYNGGPGTILDALRLVGKNKQEATWSDVVTGLRTMKAKGLLSEARFKEISAYPEKVLKYMEIFKNHDSRLGTINGSNTVEA